MGVLVGLVAACSTDAVLLPADFNEQKVKVVDIDYQIELGPPTGLPGVQGGPVATIISDSPLIEPFLKAGIDLVRVPQGYLCDYTLSGIFQSPAGDPGNPADYSFSKIDAVLAGAAALGGDIIFQAMYDLGIDTCSVGPDGIQRGLPPKDLARWTTVLVNTLRHFNSDMVAPSAGWVDPQPQKFGVRNVELWDDPMGRGGYTDAGAFAQDFVVAAEAIKAAFPDSFEGDARVAVLGPAMTVASAEAILDGTHPLVAFLDALSGAGKSGLVDVVTFQTEVRFPAENEAIARAIRTAMDERGLSDVPLWCTRYRADPAFNEEPNNVLEVPAWSNFSGAFATATKIAWQGVVDRAVFYRGDRRHRSVDGSDITTAEQSPLWDGKGGFRSAGIAWQPWRLMAPRRSEQATDTRQRVQVTGPGVKDVDGLRILAVKDAQAACPGSPLTQCPKLYVLIANTNTHLGQTQVDYQIRIQGVSEPGSESHQVTVNWSIINESTHEFTFAESNRATVVGGDLFYQLSSSVPATDFLEIELGPGS